MKYVKKYRFGGVDSKLTACIELQAPPNGATEGEVGLLAIDLSSPTHDVYKCVAVNGAVYTWELLSSGMSILSSREMGGGLDTATFKYNYINKNDNYVIKVGDLILDSRGYLYKITKLNSTYCNAEYTDICLNRDGVGIVDVSQKLISDTVNRVTIHLTDGGTRTFDVINGINGDSAYQLARKKGFTGTEEEWLDHLGYNTWIKGKAVTQEEYDALPDDEKNKPGFMYVIKDAETQVTTADKALIADKATTADALTTPLSYDFYAQVRGGEPNYMKIAEGCYIIRIDYNNGNGVVRGSGILFTPDNVENYSVRFTVMYGNPIYIYSTSFNYSPDHGWWVTASCTDLNNIGQTLSSARVRLYKIK